MKKPIKFLSILLFSACLFSQTTVLAQDTGSKSSYNFVASTYSPTDDQIAPYADVMVWRYKVINKKLYKRKYNTSKERWEGSWIPC